MTTQVRSANAEEVLWDIPDITVQEITIERGVFFNMIDGATNLAVNYVGHSTGQYNFYNYTQAIFRLHPDDGGYIYGPAYTGAPGNLGFVGSVPGTLAYASPLAPSSSVTAGNNFVISGPFYANFYAYLNMAVGQTAFIGLRFDVGADTFHGWTQITNEDGDAFTLHGFGYNDTPGAASHPENTVIPEPGSMMLLAAGAAGFGMWRRRRKSV